MKIRSEELSYTIHVSAVSALRQTKLTVGHPLWRMNGYTAVIRIKHSWYFCCIIARERKRERKREKEEIRMPMQTYANDEIRSKPAVFTDELQNSQGEVTQTKLQKKVSFLLM